MNGIPKVRQIMADAFAGKIDDDYLDRLDVPYVGIAASLRDLYHRVSDQVVCAITNDLPPLYDEETGVYWYNGANKTDAWAAQVVLPPGDGDGRQDR